MHVMGGSLFRFLHQLQLLNWLLIWMSVYLRCFVCTISWCFICGKSIIIALSHSFFLPWRWAGALCSRHNSLRINHLCIWLHVPWPGMGVKVTFNLMMLPVHVSWRTLKPITKVWEGVATFMMLNTAFPMQLWLGWVWMVNGTDATRTKKKKKFVTNSICATLH